MKKILRFLLVPVFVGSASLTVVACGTNATVWNQDILESAVGQMQNHTFKMSDDLGLNNLPSGKFTDRENLGVSNDISGYYQGLVKTNDVTWDNPTVDVQIRADEAESEFVAKYGNLVEARVSLIAHLSFRNLSKDTPIVVKITNDLALGKQRIDAIGTYLGTYLATNPTFNFPDLFEDNLTNKIEKAMYGKIEAPLREALFTTKINDEAFPVIDVEGIDIEVTAASDAEQVIYKLNDNAIDGKLIRGTLQNLSLIVHDGSFRSEPLTGQTLNIAQSVSDASTQINNILNQSLNFSVATLPQAGSSLASNANVQQLIQTALFNLIKVIYPTAKMKGTVTWDEKLIEFPNSDSNLYVAEKNSGEESKFGHFLVDMQFKFVIGPDSEQPDKQIQIDALANSIKINLAATA